MRGVCAVVSTLEYLLVTNFVYINIRMRGVCAVVSTLEYLLVTNFVYINIQMILCIYQHTNLRNRYLLITNYINIRMSGAAHSGPKVSK